MTNPTTTFTWTISQMETSTSPVEGMEDVVRVVHYRVSAVSSDGFEDGGYGSVHLGDPADPSAFVAFPNLTEATVIGWVHNALASDEGTAEEGKAQIEAAIEARIEARRNPPIQPKPLPWGS